MPNIFESSKIAIAKKATEIASDLGNTIGWGGATKGGTTKPCTS